MDVALIGDIHGNLPALEAVLAHARQEGATAVWNVGDLIGYGPFPEGVVQRLREESVLSTIGKTDLRVLRFKKKRDKWRKSKPLEEYLALEFAYDNLSKSSRKYLRFLSEELRMRVQGRRVLVTYASLGSSKWLLVPNAPDKQLRQVADEVKADVIVCGCSHRPFVASTDSVEGETTWFINPGSVGLPEDGDPRSSYAMLRFQPEAIHVTHHRIEYDIERVVAAVREYKLPDTLAQMFIEGRGLVTILDEDDDD